MPVIILMKKILADNQHHHHIPTERKGVYFEKKRSLVFTLNKPQCWSTLTKWNNKSRVLRNVKKNLASLLAFRTTMIQLPYRYYWSQSTHTLDCKASASRFSPCAFNRQRLQRMNRPWGTCGEFLEFPENDRKWRQIFCGQTPVL